MEKLIQLNTETLLRMAYDKLDGECRDINGVNFVICEMPDGSGCMVENFDGEEEFKIIGTLYITEKQYKFMYNT